MADQPGPDNPEAAPETAADEAVASDNGAANSDNSAAPRAAANGGGAESDDLVTDVPVVAVGASAGGLTAFKQFLAALPSGTGMAFVLIQHLDPSHASMLPELLQPRSPLPVEAIRDAMELAPNRVYVIAPGQNLTLLHNRLHSLPGSDGARPYHPLDVFFRSLAEDRGSRAIGVILSGTASDGTDGCRAIKEAGGITFAQSPDTAEYDAMPANAIAAGCVDFVLAPEQIAGELARLARHPLLRAATAAGAPERESVLPISAAELDKVFILLRTRVGHDFSHYKQKTMRRRITRRILLHKLDSAARYIRLLQDDVRELDALFQDILINVTGFFRDPDGFSALQGIAIPALLKARLPDAPLRVWVPGCSTGQEVYSIAMTLLEFLDERAEPVPIQVFGSDIDEAAIDTARAAIYPVTIEDELSPGRLKRWLRKVPGGYRMVTALRECCVFAVHDVTKDPPFSRLDLVSCRNLLIYMEGVLQKKVLRWFHYALQPDGFLLLGGSETIGAQADLFRLEDKRGKLYRKKAVAARRYEETRLPLATVPPAPAAAAPRGGGATVPDLERAAEQRLLEHCVPAGVLLGPKQQVLRFFGRTWPYLEHPPGAATLNLWKIAHPDLMVELRAAVRHVAKSGEDVQRESVRLCVEGAERRVDIQVLPLPGGPRGEPSMVALFVPSSGESAAGSWSGTGAGAGAVAEGGAAGAEDAAGAGDPAPADGVALARRNAELEREIADTRAYAQSIIEEQEGTNEELHSANEEVQSTNEELQSANEELETAKEELQSTNEELATVNEELAQRNDELTRSNNDLQNLLVSVDLPILILGVDLRIRQFTRAAKPLLNLISGDVGRPIGNIKPNIEVPRLEELVLEVVDDMTPKELELTDNQGHWYSIRIRPYKTLDQRIDGAVVIFIGIDDVKHLERLKSALAEERRLATVVRDSNDAVTVQDLDGTIRAWNPAAARIYGYSEQEALGMNACALVAEVDKARLQRLLHDIGAGRAQRPVELVRIGKDGRRLRTLLSASALIDDSGTPVAVATTERMLGELSAED